MADQKISELSVADELDGTELFVLVQDSGNVQMAAEKLIDHPGFVAGRWYNPVSACSVAGGAALTQDNIKLLPFFLEREITISDLGCRVTTLSGGGNVQLAIYASATATKLPTGNPLASTGSISTASAAAVSADITGSNVTLPRGLYWMAVICDNGTAALQTINSAAGLGSHLIGHATLGTLTSAAGSVALGLIFAHTFGTWPDLTGQTFTDATTGVTGLVFLKAA